MKFEEKLRSLVQCSYYWQFLRVEKQIENHEKLKKFCQNILDEQGILKKPFFSEVFQALNQAQEKDMIEVSEIHAKLCLSFFFRI